MTKRAVLIPLDGSAFSRQIVRVVRTFISPNDVELVLFRVLQPPAVTSDVATTEILSGAMPAAGSYESYSRTVDSEYSTATSQREDIRQQTEDELRPELERLRSAGYAVEAVVQFGEPAQRIIDYVNENQIDLVAMTTHGRTGFGRLVLGSVADRVMRGISVPVLLMRSEPEVASRSTSKQLLSKTLGNGIQLRIAAATDGSTLAQRAVGRAADLAEMLSARFSLLVVASDRDSSEHSQQVMEEAVQQVAVLRPRPETVPLVGYADEVLLECLSKRPVDILCIGAFQDRGAGSTTAIGPTAQRLVQYAPTSVLMYKGHQSRIRRILACLAVDDMEVVDVAAYLANRMSADLSLLHVIPPSAASYLSPADGETSAGISLSSVLSQGTRLSSILKSWVSQLEEYGIGQDAILVQQGSVPEAILRTAQEGSYDLIVVGTHSSPGHFLGSVANGVVRYAEQSVLLLRTGSN